MNRNRRAASGAQVRQRNDAASTAAHEQLLTHTLEGDLVEGEFKRAVETLGVPDLYVDPYAEDDPLVRATDLTEVDPTTVRKFEDSLCGIVAHSHVRAVRGLDNTQAPSSSETTTEPAETTVDLTNNTGVASIKSLIKRAQSWQWTPALERNAGSVLAANSVQNEVFEHPGYLFAEELLSNTQRFERANSLDEMVMMLNASLQAHFVRLLRNDDEKNKRDHAVGALPDQFSGTPRGKLMATFWRSREPSAVVLLTAVIRRNSDTDFELLTHFYV
jgi:hypothetical protein